MPYSKFSADELILRDYLARDRTALANERTLLSYIRTAIALLAAGGTLLKFFPESRSLMWLGAVLLVCGVFTCVLGTWRFVVVARRLRKAGAGPEAGTR